MMLGARPDPELFSLGVLFTFFIYVAELYATVMGCQAQSVVARHAQ
jgi:hypothetical protein